jgi:hypothetical protein
MSAWLDTETKALLQKVPPEKLAIPGTDTFTLVVLKCTGDRNRLAQLMARIAGWGRAPPGGLSSADAVRARSIAATVGVSNERAAFLAYRGAGPLVAGLSFADALLGQFDLVCRDSVSVFLNDEVVSSATKEYLNELYSQVQSSPEFDETTIRVTSIPDTESGGRFVDQFLGDEQRVLFNERGRQYSFEGKVMRKKARIMEHWGRKIGAEVTTANDR